MFHFRQRVQENALKKDVMNCLQQNNTSLRQWKVALQANYSLSYFFRHIWEQIIDIKTWRRKEKYDGFCDKEGEKKRYTGFTSGGVQVQKPIRGRATEMSRKISLLLGDSLFTKQKTIFK